MWMSVDQVQRLHHSLIIYLAVFKILLLAQVEFHVVGVRLERIGNIWYWGRH